MSVVRLRRIGKSYKGKVAVSGADFSLEPGEVLGLVGPNGAGKSTLLKIIAGFVRPTEGEGEVLGQPIGPRSYPCPFVGTMVEKPVFIEYLSGRSNLRLLASLRKQIGKGEIEAVLRRVGLEPRDKRPVSAYSQGMRQRLSLAQATMENPKLMLLDEPTNGLDPEGIVEMRGFIRQMAEEGAGVILASHLLAEVEAVCDRVIMVFDGHCVREFATKTASPNPDVLVAVSSDEQVKVVVGIDGLVVLKQIDSRTLQVRSRDGVPDLVRCLVAAGVDVEFVGRMTSSLEDAYLNELADGRK